MRYRWGKGAIAIPEFNLVGQTIHFAPPDFKQNCQFILNMFTNVQVFNFNKVDRKIIKLNHKHVILILKTQCK